MLSQSYFIQKSLALHLFFARIMKEHSFFIETALPQKNKGFIQQANSFKTEFEAILYETISLSKGVVKPNILQSGEVITKYTLRAEMATAHYTGIKIDIKLTQITAGLIGGEPLTEDIKLERRVQMLNHRAINSINALAQFKNMLLTNAQGCKIFSTIYPLMFEHLLEEARYYLYQVQGLQNREEYEMKKNMEQEGFWNEIFAEHSKFIRGLLDPTEIELMKMANHYGYEFDQLSLAARSNEEGITEESIKAMKDMIDFNTQAVKGLLDCSIQSIILPLLADHTLREANHYDRLLHSDV